MLLILFIVVIMHRGSLPRRGMLLNELFYQGISLFRQVGCGRELLDRTYARASPVDDVRHERAVTYVYPGITQHAQGACADNPGVNMSHTPKYEQQGCATANDAVGHGGAVEKRRVVCYKGKQVGHTAVGKHGKAAIT